KTMLHLIKDIGEKYSIFTNDEINDMCFSDFTFDNFTVHDALDFQLQMYKQKNISYPDSKANFNIDKKNFLSNGRSHIERMISSSLNPNKTAQVKPTGDLYKFDLTDKINAQNFLHKLNVPVPREAKLGESAFVKHARGGMSKNIFYTNSFNYDNSLNDWKKHYVAQKEITSVLNFPYCVRMNVDFGKITAACLRIDKKSKKILNLDYSKFIPLPFYGFENKNNSKKDNELLFKLEIDDRLPFELIYYSTKIGEFCSNYGMQSIGIDFVKDKDSWVCLGDINMAPGRGIYYQLMHQLNVKGYELEHDEWKYKNKEEYLNLRQNAICHFLKKPFLKWYSKN
ncbi:MAG: hypothetical protein ACLFPJ_04845, partial [Candidatus Woesearchaeota archaeon]